ncbi:MAG: hypothetical protein ACRBBR_08095 [Cellvibrionaceae bacterium]
MRFLIFISFLIISNHVTAVTADGLVREFYKVLKICNDIGFYKCQDEHFQGSTRGIFHLPIEKQKLKITENEYKDFIERNTKNRIDISFLKKTVNIDFNLENNFDMARFLPGNIEGSIDPLNPDNTLFKIKFKNTPPIVLINTSNIYKLGILPVQENEYRKTSDYKKSYLLRLKNNILRFHMKEAEMLNYDMRTLHEKVSEAQAPILFTIEKGIVPDFVKDYMSKRTMKDIQRFYIQLDTEEKIINRIKKVHKL